MLDGLYKCFVKQNKESPLSETSNLVNYLDYVLMNLPKDFKDEAIDHIIEFLKSQQSPTKT